MSEEGESSSVTRFREYLRFPTGHPNPDYSGCMLWLQNQAEEIGLSYNFLKLPDPGEFAIWMTWPGSEPSLKSILLNSHMDVVPVEIGKWTRDPFGAEKDSDGNIYGRGAQDMKCVGVQYLEAIRRLISKKFVPLRTVHISFVPEEEVGGFRGMKLFVKTPEFQGLNVGFALDEGIASTDEAFTMFYGERVGWNFTITAKGPTGHASLLPDQTAAEKLFLVTNKLHAIREEQRQLLISNPELELGDVTTLNLVALSGGVSENVIPSELSAEFTMRLSSKLVLNDAIKLIENICTESGTGISLSYVHREYGDVTPITILSNDSIWWTTFKSTCEDLGIKIRTKIFPAATDSRYLRQIGLPAFGFSPINNTPILLHDHNEFLNEKVFERGIDIYEVLVQNFAKILPKK